MTGMNCENEWSREGRRIIPLLNREPPITVFTSKADEARASVDALNSHMKFPHRTRTRQPQANQQKTRGLMPPPPPPLSSIISNGGETVTPPAFSFSKAKSGQDNVVKLITGTVVRLKNSNEHTSKSRRKRKRDLSQINVDEPITYEIISSANKDLKGNVANINKRRRVNKVANNKAAGAPHNQHHLATDPGGHGYARPFLPQVPSPINEIDPKLQRQSPLAGSSSKVDIAFVFLLFL